MRPYRVLFAAALMFSIASCGDGDTPKQPENNTTTNTTQADNGIPRPESIVYQLVNQYPHNTSAYTEGLEYVDGYIYEGTGHYGGSFIAKTELATGKELQRKDLDQRYFGEGITVMGDKIYQLTYKARRGFVYDKKTFKEISSFNFNTTEGWGMTNDGTHLIYSDGTDMLHFLNPNTFQEERSIKVRDRFGPVNFINELEYINGYIYANQWQTDLILKIDLKTGYVVATANLSTIRQRTGIPPVTGDESAPEFLNGIAYDKENNRIFITGKNWPKIFEIKLDN